MNNGFGVHWRGMNIFYMWERPEFGRTIKQTAVDWVMWSHEMYVDVLTPVSQNVSFLKNRVDAGVKMRSLRWPLIQYDWCPHTKGKSGHRHMQTRRTPCADDDRYWGGAPIHWGRPETHQKLHEMHETHSPSQPSERANSADILLLHFVAFRTIVQ